MLRVSISMEKYLTFLENVRQWHEDGRDRVPIKEILELLVPCILHLENRVGEKLLNTILRKAIDLQNNGQKEHFLKAMQHTFQSKIFGTDNSPSQWKLRYEKGPGDGNITLESIQMRNKMARRCISSIDEIIEAAFMEGTEISHQSIEACTKYQKAMSLLTIHHDLSEDEIECFQTLIDAFMEGTEISHQLIEACTKYQEAMSLLTIHRDLSEDEIECFQTLIDDFYEIWVDTFESEGISNYIHMLGARHVMYFLNEYKWLYLLLYILASPISRDIIIR
jgi:predicted transcriptional regulator